MKIALFYKGKARGPYKLEEVKKKISEGNISINCPYLLEGEKKINRISNLISTINKNTCSNTKINKNQEIKQNMTEEKLEEKTDNKIQSETLSELIHKGHPSLLHYPKLLTLIIIFFILTFYLFSKGESRAWLSFAIGSGLLTYLLIERKCDIHRINTLRVENIYGIITKNSDEVRLEDISSINVRTDSFRGIIGVGNVEIYTAGDEPEVILRNVWQAQKVKEKIRRAQDSL